MPANEFHKGDLWIVYDGQCPFCSSYVRLYRLKTLFERVHLIDARSHHAVVEDIRGQGLDLDEGMVVKLEDRLYHGAQAMQLLALLGSGSGLFNWLNRALFRHRKLALKLYPLLVRGRLFTLRLLRRPQLGLRL